MWSVEFLKNINSKSIIHKWRHTNLSFVTCAVYCDQLIAIIANFPPSRALNTSFFLQHFFFRFVIIRLWSPKQSLTFFLHWNACCFKTSFSVFFLLFKEKRRKIHKKVGLPPLRCYSHLLADIQIISLEKYDFSFNTKKVQFQKFLDEIKKNYIFPGVDQNVGCQPPISINT